jgi:hypothetical protein
MVVGIVVISLLVVAAAVVLGIGRRPRQDDGIETFRRHIDALSPEARQAVTARNRRRTDGNR